MITHDSTSLLIYTDGSCRGNPGVGGWAALLLYQNQEYWVEGHADYTTNNRMELQAVVSALRAVLDRDLPISASKTVIVTDSQYVKNGIEIWSQKWVRNNWRTANNKPVKNKDLWVDLLDLNERVAPVWQWTRGHSGNIHNERVDKRAFQATENAIRDK